MSYTPTTWKTGDTVSSTKLNKIENGIADLDTELSQQKNAIDQKITSPSSPSTGAFLVWNGTVWVAQTLATWQGGNY